MLATAHLDDISCYDLTWATSVVTRLFAEESVKHYISITPLGRLGEPKDIAAVAVFLASDSSSWVTGETIRAGGGAR